MPIQILPPAGAPRVLATAQLCNSLGDGAYYVTSALYFTRVVGLSPTQIGLALTVAWAIGSVTGVPLGALADRRGPRSTATLLALATGASVAGLATGPAVRWAERSRAVRVGAGHGSSDAYIRRPTVGTPRDGYSAHGRPRGDR